MPLIPPVLDDRSYDDLVQEMLANIPAHTPEWTNPQPGDPGRTLVELFAWLADTILYRANLIPEKQRIAFLKLLGQTMQPAAAATGVISLSLDPASVTPVAVAAGAKVSGAVNFETLSEIDLLPITAQAYIKVPLTADQQKQSMPLLAGLKKLYNLSTLPAGYTTTPVFANNLGDPNGIDIVNGTTRLKPLAGSACLEAGESCSRAQHPRPGRTYSQRRLCSIAHRSWALFRDTARRPPCRQAGR